MSKSAVVKIRALSKSEGRNDVAGITLSPEILSEAGWSIGDHVRVETKRRVATSGDVILIVKAVR